MKHLFIARHGDDSGFGLTDLGKQQIEKLADSIKKIVKGPVYLMSSIAGRAIESSEILKSRLDLVGELEREDRLWTGDNPDFDSEHPSFNYDLKGLLNFIEKRSDRAEGLVVMTHHEVVRNFPHYFLRQKFSKEEIIKRPVKGQAVHFDLEGKSYQTIPNSC
jgi:broad specificity phosphatase PhoE